MLNILRCQMLDSAVQLSRSQAQLVPPLFCHLVNMNFILIYKSIHIYINTHKTIVSVK